MLSIGLLFKKRTGKHKTIHVFYFQGASEDLSNLLKNIIGQGKRLLGEAKEEKQQTGASGPNSTEVAVLRWSLPVLMGYR